jgi:hypothetical protein
MMPGMINYPAITKKYVFDLLQGRYVVNENMINRLTHYLTSEQDVKDFCQIIADSYSQGYLKAVNDYRQKLKEVGYDVTIN